MIFIISTTYDSIRSSGYFYWGAKYYPSIKNYLPDIPEEIASIKKAIVYFAKPSDKFRDALQVKVTAVQRSNNSLKIIYESDKTLYIKSFQIKDVLKQIFRIDSVLNLPYCCAVDKEQFYNVLEDQNIYSTISKLTEQNAWDEIYKLFQKYEAVEINPIWNNARILNMFAFATAKLSECYIDLKKAFKNDNERKAFLKEKKFLRQLTIKLRKRAIELEPQNASYYSNLAYTFYQSVHELTFPRSRRDGSIVKDAENAITYINKALEYDPLRITDLYRKGVLLTDFLGEYLFFSEYSNEENNNIAYSIYREKIKQGIETFDTIINIYHDLGEELMSKKKKVYVKSLYKLANSYLTLVRMNHNLLENYLTSKIIRLNSGEEDREYLNKAEELIDKCIKADYSKNRKTDKLEELLDCNNFEIAVNKSYLKGLINLYRYKITKDNTYAIEAKKYLNLANEISYPKEMQNQNKIFVLEKLAVLNVISGKAEIAVKMLEPLYRKMRNFPPYAAYTLAVASLVAKNNDLAAQIINEFKNCRNKIFQKKFELLEAEIRTYTPPKLEI
jgi:hypothetical protein